MRSGPDAFAVEIRGDDAAWLRGRLPEGAEIREVDETLWWDRVYERSESGLYLPQLEDPAERFVREAEARAPKPPAPVGIDLFAGCGGFSLGMHEAGFDVVAGVECDVAAAWTYLLTVMAQPIHRNGSPPWPRHTYQILTKRPERAAAFLSRLRWRFGTRHGGPWKMAGTGDRMITPIAVLDSWGDPEPAPNIWIGTSVEDQTAADERIPHLLRAPAALRFLSCEPLLGRVDLTDLVIDDGRPGEWHFDALHCDVDPRDDAPFYGATIDWVIVGGESGPRARECNIEWIRSIVEQCRTAGVPAFVKQLGSQPYRETYSLHADRSYPVTVRLAHSKGGDIEEWPKDLRVREFPEVAGA